MNFSGERSRNYEGVKQPQHLFETRPVSIIGRVFFLMNITKSGYYNL
jgi:hypothetical protein